MRSASKTIIFLLGLFLAAPMASYSASSAAGWQARLDDQPGLPSTLIAVDKEQQQLFLFTRQSPLAISAKYTCTTGQVEGDKQDEGDKKTPEGVYFVDQHIRNGLDFKLYGGIAYTLNYPNPMDVLRNKSGHGIWVHGRGHTIVPRETQGCVAMNNNDLVALGQSLTPGTPVVLAQKVITASPQTTEERKVALVLTDMTREWATAWSNRDTVMFEYYDPKPYSLSNSGSFDDLVATKTRLFNSLPWILNWIDDIRVLQGPDYWVTWFKQYYRAPNLTVQGRRRLYWHKNAEGNLLIAGMEWAQEDLDLEPHFLEARKPDILKFVEHWRTAWESGNIAKYAECYTASAKQGDRVGLESIRQQKKVVWAAAHPKKVRLSDFQLVINNNGLTITMVQRYSSSDGFSDTGTKTLVLRPHGISWLIESEDWRAL